MDAFLVTGFTTVVVYVSLATLLHLQYGKAGIVNFGVVGFVGIGMYSFGVLTVTHQVPFLLALLIATLLTGLVAFGLGLLILDLDAESVLVATLAFATIVFHLVTTEKWLTNGVVGLGTIPFPFDFGRDTRFYLMLLLTFFAALIVFYAYRVGVSPYGRLLFAIQDNEPLAKGLGKPTTRQKLVFFTVTSAAMGFIGAWYASATQFLVPQIIGASLTFTVWIALIIGGRKRVLGGALGVIVTVALFDIFVERYAELPPDYAQQLPNLKLMLYGLVLMLVILFRPVGLLGERRVDRP